MEGLLRYDSEGNLKNALAESYQMTNHNRRLIFHLRKNIFWSDKRPIRPEDFMTAIRRALHPKTTSKLADLLLPIQGAKNYRSGKSENLGIRTENQTLIIDLEEAAPYLIQVFALPITTPMRKDILDINNGKWPENAPVTGPYQITEHQIEQKITLETNLRYWKFMADTTKPDFQKVIFQIIPEESTAVNLFEANQLDILIKIPSFEIERLRKKYTIHTDPFLATYFLAFNVKKAPFNQRAWRRAIAGSIKRDQIATSLLSGELPALSWIPKGIEGYYPYQNPENLYVNSINKIRNFTKSKIIQKKIYAGFDSSGRNRMIMEKVQQDLFTSLGLRIELENYDWKTYINLLSTNAPQIFRFGWLAPILDPMIHLLAFTSNNPNNYTGWSNSHYDRLVHDIGTESSGPKREIKIKTAQKILLEEEAIVIPIYHYAQTHVVSSNILNFQVNPFGIIYFNELQLKPY